MRSDKKRDEKITSLLFSIMIVLCYMIVVMNMLTREQVVSSVFQFILVGTSLTFFFSIYYGYNLNGSLALMIGSIILIFAFIVISLNTESISLVYYKKYVFFASTIIMMITCTFTRFKRYVVALIFSINILLSASYIIFYLFGRAYLINGSLTLNFTNPNLLAIWLMHSILISSLAIDYNEHTLWRLSNYLVIAINAYLVFLTKTRSVQLALLFYIIYVVLLKYDSFNRVKRVLPFLVSIYPIMFSKIYLVLIDRNDFVRKLAFLASTGKPIESRYSAWEYAYTFIKQRPLLGNYNTIYRGTEKLQMYNTHLEIAAAYGVIELILVIILLYYIISQSLNRANTKLKLKAVGAFIAVNIVGAGESALFVGSLGMFILSCALLLIANHEDVPS